MKGEEGYTGVNFEPEKRVQRPLRTLGLLLLPPVAGTTCGAGACYGGHLSFRLVIAEGWDAGLFPLHSSPFTLFTPSPFSFSREERA